MGTHMQAFKSLWQPRGTITIPTYGPEDSPNLQVKALLYVYRRFDIVTSGDKLERVPVDDLNSDDLRNLDKMYNVDQFLREITTDPHRVLFEWPKNRFRAMLLLPRSPDMDQIPKFGHPTFRFSVLPLTATPEEYVTALSESNMYTEHTLPIDIRREIAFTVIGKTKPLTSEQRREAILKYLRLLATEIQVGRIYKAMLNKQQPQLPHSSSQSSLHPPLNHSTSHSSLTGPILVSPKHSPTVSPTASPTASPTISPTVSSFVPPRHSPSASPVGFPQKRTFTRFPKLPPAPSLASLPTTTQPQQPPSPRLRLKPSQNFKLATPSPTLVDKKLVLQQARAAVQARIEKEQQMLLHERTNQQTNEASL